MGAPKKGKEGDFDIFKSRNSCDLLAREGKLNSLLSSET